MRILTCLLSSGVFLNSYTLPILAQAQSNGSNAGCPPGTRESPVNLVRNGNFTTNAGTGLGVVTPRAPVPAAPDFTSDLPYRGDAVYPEDDPITPTTGGGGLSIQDERFNGGQIPGAPAGIVNGRGVTATEAAQVGVEPIAIPTYLYSNPNLNSAGQPVTVPPAAPGTPAPVVWSQTLTVAPNTVYNFKALFFNLLLPNALGVDPRIRLRFIYPANVLNQTPFPIVVGDGSPVPGFSSISNTRQAWIPVQFSAATPSASVPGQNTIQIQLQIVDESQNIIGDDFGLTAVGLRECVPNIGVAKQAGTPSANGDGTFTIPYTVRVRNLAPAVGFPDPYVLNNVQLTEDLTSTFANTTIVAIGAPQSPTLVVNPAFNGTTDTRLLQNNVNSLAASSEGLVTFNVTIRPNFEAGGGGPYTNRVVATANTSSGVQVLDRSNDGTNVDPDSDGNPGNNDDPTIVALPGQANVLLVKRITNVIRAGGTLPGVNFGGFVDDPASADDNNPAWAQLVPPGFPSGIIALPNDNPVRSGDEVEYTVYFLSNGSNVAEDTSVCDPIPVGTTLVSNTAQVRVGTSAVRSGGTVFTPLAPLPSNNSCPDQRNPNGAVIFDLGTLPNTPTNNIGFVRFRVRIN
ncbi:MAG: hypothetical protein NW224_07920 [Leptolyngbyaceae cyanobacterium bins.302]|nr:hypothetical protein [Leptolyngbyaceae cyanobacterium bins.302]